MVTYQDVNQEEYKFRSDNTCSLLNVHTCPADGSTVLLGSSCSFVKLGSIDPRSFSYEKIGLVRSASTAYCVIKKKEIRRWYKRNSCCHFKWKSSLAKCLWLFFFKGLKHPTAFSTGKLATDFPVCPF